MGFCITDLGDPERSTIINFWNWRPTVELIRAAGILDAERLERLHIQCCGTLISMEEAREIARHLREKVLPTLRAESRVLLDGSSTEEPDDGTFYRSPEEYDRNYGATYSWLEEFAAFCEQCAGFEVN